jgi:hypothetical protein
MRKVNGPAGDTIQLHGIKRGKNVAGNCADGDSLPRTDDEVRQDHHPPGYEADVARKYFGCVSNFGSRVWHSHDELSIDIADGKQ